MRNSVVAMTFYLVQLLVQFVARRIFLDYLGTEVLGLNTTAQNILQFLNLAELGIGVAISFMLFKPIAESDHETINEIVDLQGRIYARIGWFLLGGAVLLSLFFPVIFSKMQLPLWYAYASFGALLTSSLLSYFFNYRQVVLSASQQEYKITIYYKVILLLRVICQAIGVRYSSHPFLAWVLIEVFFAVLATVSLHIITKKSFPYLQRTAHNFRSLRNKYPDFTTKIKQLLFHKIGLFALTQTSPIIIYAYTTLTEVTLYGNYLLVISGVQMMVTAMFSGIGASVGNLVASGDSGSIRKVFLELQALYFLIGTTIVFIIYCEMSPFISLWIGPEYIMPRSTLLLMLGMLYIATTRYTIDNFIMATGLYGDIWAPVVEASINIGLSVLFGAIWGLNGVLMGVLCSQIIVICIWKPYYLFSRKLSSLANPYLLQYLKLIVCMAVSVALVYFAVKHIGYFGVPTIGQLIFNTSLTAIIFIGIMIPMMLLMHTGIGSVLSRFRRIF